MGTVRAYLSGCLWKFLRMHSSPCGWGLMKADAIGSPVAQMKILGGRCVQPATLHLHLGR